MVTVTLVNSKSIPGIGSTEYLELNNLTAKTIPNRIGKITNLFLSIVNFYIRLKFLQLVLVYPKESFSDTIFHINFTIRGWGVDGSVIMVVDEDGTMSSLF